MNGKLTRIKMMVDVLGYLLFASGLHLLLVTVKPSDGTYLGGRFKYLDQFKIGGNLNPSNMFHPSGGQDASPSAVNSNRPKGLSASVVDSDNINEYEEEMKLNMFTINAQKLLRGSAVQSPLSVLLGMKSMPKIVSGKIIAGDSTNVQVTILKKLPDLEKNPELPNDYPNYDKIAPNYPDYIPYDDYHPKYDMNPDYDNIKVGSY